MSGFLRRSGLEVLRAGIQMKGPPVLLLRRGIITRASASGEFLHPCFAALPKTVDPYPIFIGFPLAAISQMMELMAQKKYNPVSAPICFAGDKKNQSWISQIHTDHRHRAWGQTLSVFPPAIQARLCKIRPGLLRDHQVLWGDMQDLSHYMLMEAREAGFQVIEETVKHMSAEGVVSTQQGNSFNPVDPNWFTYNFAKSHRTPELTGFTTTPHIDLYTKSIEEIKFRGASGLSACTVGNGLSFVWFMHHLGEHFPHTLCLHNPGIQTPAPPSIAHVDYTTASMGNVQQTTIRQLADSVLEITSTCMATNRTLTVLTQELHATAGFEPCTHLTEEVPAHRKLDLPGLKVSAPLLTSSATVVVGSIPDLSLRMQERGGEAPLIHNAYSATMAHKLQRELTQVGVILPANYQAVLKESLDAQIESDIGGSEYLLALHLNVFDKAIQQDAASAEHMTKTAGNREKYEAFLREKLALPKSSAPKPKFNA